MHKLSENIGDSFFIAFSGMITVVLAIAAFIFVIWIVIAAVRTIAGLG